MKKKIDKSTFLIIVASLVALHPLIELDYLAYDWLNSFGLPRPSTIINLVVLPLLVILAFILFDDHKKKTIRFLAIYCLFFIPYFIIHCKVAMELVDQIELSANFYFTLKDETVYTIGLLTPLAYIYVYSLTDLKKEIYEKTCIALSCFTSIPIFISNLLVFGKATYRGDARANIFEWFSLPYDDNLNHPKYYGTKFYFQEGNTIGILMIMVLPLLYYFFHKAETKKKRIFLGILIFVHSIAMMMLSTRVSTYGSIAVPIVFLLVYGFVILLKKEKIQKTTIILVILIIVINSAIVPYCPAYQNQLYDAEDTFNLESASPNGEKKAEMRKNLQEGLKFIHRSDEWFGFYTYFFEDNKYLINATPSVYFTEYYPYTYDPKFWVDVIMDYDLEDRINGRQIEAIFENYKWSYLDFAEKLTGMGYSTFMWGSILLERDFAQQIYSFGYIGFALIMLPWLLIAAAAGLCLLFGYKKGHWNFFNITLMMSICIGYGCSYLSGHTIDQLTTSMFIILSIAMLMKEMKTKGE